MIYDLYLDEALFPVPPSKVVTKVKNQNKTLNLINDGEINFLKSAGLTEIQFEVLIPHTPYPFARYIGGFKDIPYYLSVLESLKKFGRAFPSPAALTRWTEEGKAEPFYFKLSRFYESGMKWYGTEIWVSLEDYQITEDAKDGLDLTVAVKLKQYRHFGTKTVTINQSGTGEQPAATIETPRAADSAPAAKTYTVSSGDTLWNISKKCLGDGSRYPEIQALNRDKITNPNLIRTGQVLTLP